MLAGGVAVAPVDYLVPGTGQIRPKAIYAAFDGSGAGSAFLPALKIISDSGDEVGIYPTTQAVAAGGSATVSWFPGIGPYPDDDDEPPEVGGVQAITSPGATISVSSPTGPTTSLDLPASGVTAATYGDGTHVAQIAVDAEGRVTSAADVAITASAGVDSLDTLTGALTLAAGANVTITDNSPVAGSIKIDAVSSGVLALKGALIYNSVTQGTTNGVRFKHVYDSVGFDTDTMANLANNRLVCKTAGYYLLVAGVGYAANTNGIRQAVIYLNGDYVGPTGTQLGLVSYNAAATGNSETQVLCLRHLAVNDYVTGNGYQNSGSNINTDAGLSKEFLGAILLGS